MKQKTFFVCDECDLCGFMDEVKDNVAKHESYCLPQQERERQRRLQREMSGHLTIAQIIEKCEALPNLEIKISSDIEKYNGMSPVDTDSYRGSYDELAIDFDRGVVMLSDFLKEMNSSLRRIYHGYRGGEYGMYRNTFVWVASYGDTGLMVTDVCLSPDGNMIHLVIK